MQYLCYRKHVSRPGFSLIELLVAITLSLIMIAIIDRLFLDTTKAVGVGIGLNDIMNNGQTFYDQIQRDAGKMLGPTSNGFLVIINKKYTYATNGILVESSRTGPQPADIRSDQLAFIIANNTDDVPMTPGRSDTYYNAARATNSRVWYGHVTRWPWTSAADDHGLGNGIEKNANQWHLGRQQAFLAKGQLGSGALQTETAIIAATLNDANLYLGKTDVVDQVLSEPTTGIKEILDGLTGTAYQNQVLAYTYAAKRLRFTPRPQYNDTSNPHYATAMLAPMHSDFLANTSDFTIEFAGDLDNDGVIDHDSGQIRWYSGYPISGSDTDMTAHPLPQSGDMATGKDYTTIKSYKAVNSGSGSNYSTFDSKYQPAASVGAFPLADCAFVWRHDNTQAFTAAGNANNCSWPYMIRIRVRLHDTKGDVVGSTLSNIKDTATDPVLVANRGKTIPGRWFEQIIKVPRP